MTEAEIETKKRQDLINEFVNDIKSDVLGVILVGSMAYAPNENVRTDSDIDLIVVYEDVKKCAKDYFYEADYLLKETYDGYLVKRHENLGHKPDLKSKNSNNLNLSIHNINFSALQKISYGNYETLAYYRQSQKGTTYYSKDFDGNECPFKPDCVSVAGLSGERRIDMIAFQSQSGNYVIGNDIDKLLSGAKIIYDKDGRMQTTLNNLWLNVTKKLIEHRKTHNQNIDVSNEDIGLLLFRYTRFSDSVKQDIKDRTELNILANLRHEQELNKQEKRNSMLKNIQRLKDSVVEIKKSDTGDDNIGKISHNAVMQPHHNEYE